MLDHLFLVVNLDSADRYNPFARTTYYVSERFN